MGRVMERIARRRLMVIIMTIITVTLIILSLIVAIEVDDDPLHSSPYLPSTLASSSKDLKIRNLRATFIKVGREILHKLKGKIGLGKPKGGSSSSDIPNLGSKGNLSKNMSHHRVSVTYGFHMMKRKKQMHTMEDYVVAEFRQIDEHKLGLFGIFDGYASHVIPAFLQSHLLNNIITEPEFWTEPMNAVKGAYLLTDTSILEESKQAGLGLTGSTAVTAILINNHDQSKLLVANVGDSRAVICCNNNGTAKQLSIDHVPSNEMESEAIKKRGGFITKGGRSSLVNGVLDITRAFGIKDFKNFISCEPDVVEEMIDVNTEFLVLASHPVWKVMTNQEVVNSIRKIKNAWKAAKHVIREARYRKNLDDISCVVVRFQ